MQNLPKLPYVRISEIHNFVGQSVIIKGWLYNRSSKGKLHFLKVRDGSGIIQCVVFKGDVDEDTFYLADHIRQESSLIVWGKVREEKRAPFIGYEIAVEGLKLIHMAEEYPITPKEHGVGFLMDHRHLWIRSRRQHAILLIRHEVVAAIRDFLNNNGFVLVDAPIFTPNACEGTTTLFETEYFGTKAYLSQSGQLYAEAAAAAFGKVYCFGPTFRAEKSKTRRHLTEFWMVEPEMAFADLEEDMRVAEQMVAYIVERVLERRMEQLKVLERDTSKLENVKTPFPRLHYNDAHKMLIELGMEHEYGDDFGGDEETALANQFDKPFFVHHFPAQVKAFYMKRDPEEPELTLSMDCLAPEGYGEIIGGGQREDDYETLLKRIREENLPEEAFDWYLDLRKYGSFPHSGFGLGVERTVAWICGIRHVRETIPFPRLIDRLKP